MKLWLSLRVPIDRLIAVILMVLLAPMILVLVLIIKASSKGPGLIRLPRLGKGGKLFMLWKLRTMRTRASEDPGSWAPIAGLNDPRITHVGRLLRRYRLDEIPQLLNVIVGEMALIGPRPETPEYVDLESPSWRLILQARPGIVGPTQVLVADWESEVMDRSTADNPYGDEILPHKLAIDEWYLKKASLALDLMVIAGLVKRFFHPVAQTGLFKRIAVDLPAVADAVARGFVASA